MPELPVVNPDNILTVEELASRLKVSPAWVFEKTRTRSQFDNPLPAMRIGRYLRFDWSQVSAWLQSTITPPRKRKAA
jgi:excisionase family DNA binding protein